jgi:hypothetical protein
MQASIRQADGAQCVDARANVVVDRAELDLPRIRARVQPGLKYSEARSWAPLTLSGLADTARIYQARSVVELHRPRPAAGPSCFAIRRHTPLLVSVAQDERSGSSHISGQPPEQLERPALIADVLFRAVQRAVRDHYIADLQPQWER